MAERERVKLFVGQVPKHMTETQIFQVFEEFAHVDEISIIRDKVTGASRGCCFVVFPSREEADKAVDACHDKKTLPGASSPLQVKYADGELERLEHKLFVGMLPKNVSDADVAAIFSEYGTIKELQLLRGSLQTNKVCAFLKFERKDQALAAIEAVNGKHAMEGSTIPLVVKWADTEKEREARRAQKAFSQESSISNISSTQHPALYGALPMGYWLSYNGYGYQNQNAFHNLIQPLNLGNSVCGITPVASPATISRNYAVSLSPTSYVQSSYPPQPGVQYTMPYLGGIMSTNPRGVSPGFLSPSSANTHSLVWSTVSPSQSQIEGPPGANLFIYNIPQEFGDNDLANAFKQFGRVLSAKVFVDKATGLSKCFGFVSYDLPVAAQNAINEMNGFQLGGKRLKVQLKRDKIS